MFNLLGQRKGTACFAHYQSSKTDSDRVENLNELVNATVGFVNEHQVLQGTEEELAYTDTLTAFLAHAALEAGDHQASTGAEALQLMTVHAAKGLEFHAVFISGLEEGLFPHEQSMNEHDGIEEERRLMYVAITRARRRLYLSLAQARMLHGQTRYGIASRFLAELPEGLLKWITTAPFYASAEPAFSGAHRKDSSGSGWRIGQNVKHPKFGAGVIINCEGGGADARVQVSFSASGVKWLALEYANLAPA